MRRLSVPTGGTVHALQLLSSQYLHTTGTRGSLFPCTVCGNVNAVRLRMLVPPCCLLLNVVARCPRGLVSLQKKGVVRGDMKFDWKKGT